MNLIYEDQSVSVQKALTLAAKAHIGQIRKYTGEPYINHCIRVASIIKSMNHSNYVIVAALLHDVVEDTDVSLMDISFEFGPKVAELVQACTAPIVVGANRAARKQAFVEQIKKAPKAVKDIKLADLIDNVPSIVENDLEFALTYVVEKRLCFEHALKESGHPVLVTWAQNVLNLSEAILRYNITIKSLIKQIING